MLTVEVKDSGVQDALQALSRRISNMQPIMQAIGEDIMERTKQRFGTSTGPDGKRWQPNSVATIQAMLAKTRSKKGGVTKNGNLSKKSQTSLAGKRVLVDTGELANSFRYQIINSGRGVEVGTNRFAGMFAGGAGVHQFGSKNGKIPARPFLPVRLDGSLYPGEQRLILDALNDYLAGK